MFEMIALLLTTAALPDQAAVSSGPANEPASAQASGPVPAPVAPVAGSVAPAAESAIAPVPAPRRGEPRRPPIVGGYAPVNPRAPELAPVIQAAVAQLSPVPHARAKVLAAERQVVAGTNYQLRLKLRDGSRWRVVVWQRLDGGREVTEAEREDR